MCGAPAGCAATGAVAEDGEQDTYVKVGFPFAAFGADFVTVGSALYFELRREADGAKFFAMLTAFAVVEVRA